MDTEEINMKIAVLSGKGGIGKTLVAVNLAAVAGRSVYIDCDVEEPNGHLFFKPEITENTDINILVPSLNTKLCTGCRKCIDFCKFNAIAYIKDKPMIFEEVCHSCGGCSLVCPVKAFTEKGKCIGVVKKGKSDNVITYSGILNIGEASGIPLIEHMLCENKKENTEFTFIDCPPGSACIVMESIKDADYCILVGEPTLFGVHNFGMVYELVKQFGKPFGAVLNKCIKGENPTENFCNEKEIKILAKIPFDNELGKLNSKGKIAARESEKYAKLFNEIFEKVKKEVRL